jgi:WD40 repeat protein
MFRGVCVGIGWYQGARGDKVINIWDVEKGEVKCALTVNSYFLSVSFSPDSATDIIAAGCLDGKIHLVDALTAQVKRSVTVDLFVTVNSVAFSPDHHDGSIIAAAYLNEIQLFDALRHKHKKNSGRP